MTIASSCARPSGLELIWRVSHIIITPMRSQASTHSGVGILCEVRTALQPISRSTPSRKALQPVGQGRAHAGVILVIAGALNLERLAVEEEALVGVEERRAHAKAHSLGITGLAAGLHGHNRRVKVRSIHRPERRIRQPGGCCKFGATICINRLISGFGRGHGLARCVQNLPAHLGALGLFAFIVHHSVQRQMSGACH